MSDNLRNIRILIILIILNLDPSGFLMDLSKLRNFCATLLFIQLLYSSTEALKKNWNEYT